MIRYKYYVVLCCKDVVLACGLTKLVAAQETPLACQTSWNGAAVPSFQSCSCVGFFGHVF